MSYEARKILLRARKHWTKVDTASLWSFSLLADTKQHNELLLDKNGKSQLENFTDPDADKYCKDYHP